MSDSKDERIFAKNLPTSDEVSAAAYDVEKTADLVSRYQLTAVEIAQLLDRLTVKPVPW
ncbi:hypothetical protein [Haliangium sp.]|uniref:hypothetical protein n=1 Tax=Haliangium sp. TaxID=2663208 RepID=UPI003D0C19B0